MRLRGQPGRGAGSSPGVASLDPVGSVRFFRPHFETLEPPPEGFLSHAGSREAPERALKNRGSGVGPNRAWPTGKETIVMDESWSFGTPPRVDDAPSRLPRDEREDDIDLDKTVVDGRCWQTTEDFQHLVRCLQEAREKLDAAQGREEHIIRTARARELQIVRNAEARERHLRDELDQLRETCDKLVMEKLELVAQIDEMVRTRQPAAPAVAPSAGAAYSPHQQRQHGGAAIEGFESQFGTESLLDIAEDAPDTRDASIARQLRSSWMSLRTVAVFGVAVAAVVFLFYAAKQELKSGVSRVNVPIHATYGTPSRFEHLDDK